MAVSLIRIGLKGAFANVEKTASFLAVKNAQSNHTKKVLHTNREPCHGPFCFITIVDTKNSITREKNWNLAPRIPSAVIRRAYGKQHGRQEERRKEDSDSDSDSDTECKGKERSEFWRRKMRTVHNILDVDKDGLISFNDFQLFTKRFTALGHLHQDQAKEFENIMKITWEQQWGEVQPYNLVTVEKYLDEMHHVLSDKSLKKKAHRWLPYLFKAVDKDKSGFISVNEFKLFFQCLGLSNEQAAVAFAVIDINGDGKLSMKEFVKLGKEYFLTEDETRVSKMFWGPLVELGF